MLPSCIPGTDEWLRRALCADRTLWSTTPERQGPPASGRLFAVPRRCLLLLSKGKDSPEQKDEEFSLAGVYTNKNEIWFASAYSSVYGLCVQVPANVMIHNRRRERTYFPANYVALYLYPFRVEKVARGSRPHTAAGRVSSPCVVDEKWVCWRLDTFLLLFCVLTAVRSYQYHIRRSRCVLIFL